MIELNFPQSNKSGTSINSRMFIIATTSICVIALKRDLIPLKIHMAINISDTPIALVISPANSSPKIPDTICSCLGTRFRTLQKSPFAIHTIAIR